MKYAINSFVRRQTADSPYTHFDGTEEELIQLVENAPLHREGYRPGVHLAVVDCPERFYTGLVELKEGDKLVGHFTARQEGETPRIHIFRDSEEKKTPCVRVEVVCYSHDVLAEDNDAETDAEFEIICINGFPTDEAAPIDPMTLMHNHFGSDGGTKTNMSAEEFEDQMRRSFNYWKNKVLTA